MRTPATSDGSTPTVVVAVTPAVEAVMTALVPAATPVTTAWVEAHLDRLGGWRLAPQALVDQLDALTEPDPLVLVPRRQKRHLNSQLTVLGGRGVVRMHQDLDAVDFKHLNERLRANSMQEKLANAWLEHLLAQRPDLLRI